MDKIPRIPGPENAFNDGTEHSVRRFQQGKVTVEIFPEGYILLDRELATGYHPKLVAMLQGVPNNELDERLLVCATYTGFFVKGEYTIQDRSQLCASIAGRLQVLRDPTKGEKPGIIIERATKPRGDNDRI